MAKKKRVRLQRPARLYPNSPDSHLGRLVAALDEIGCDPEWYYEVVAVPKPRANARTPHARTTDPSTSHAAARIVEATTMGPQMHALLGVTNQAATKGMTWEEAGNAAGIRNCWRRMSDLEAKGYLVIHGERVSPTTGKAQRVYFGARYAPGANGQPEPDEPPDPAEPLF